MVRKLKLWYFCFTNPHSAPPFQVVFSHKENKEHIDRKEFYTLSFVFFVLFAFKCIQTNSAKNLFFVRLPMVFAN